jgi:hypothetical protein
MLSGSLGKTDIGKHDTAIQGPIENKPHAAYPIEASVPTLSVADGADGMTDRQGLLQPTARIGKAKSAADKSMAVSFPVICTGVRNNDRERGHNPVFIRPPNGSG